MEGKYSNATRGQWEAVWNRLGGEEGVARFLRGETMVVPVVSTTPAPEPMIDPMIHVDRSVRPTYPSWVKAVMHLELEDTGPTEYSVETVQLWLHDDQESQDINGTKIYSKLTADGLDNCLGLRDLEEIQKRGITFFRKHFRGKLIVGWRSVVQNSVGSLSAPCLYEGGGKVILGWDAVDGLFNSSDPAARFAT